MAGDWIKMRADLHTHPKVVRMASALKADRLRIVGGLHSAWCLFDVHSVDGFLDGYSAETLDDLIGFPGFSRAMMAVGWLEENGESLVMPRFEAHNGQSAKRRAQDADRKRKDRKASASEADKKRTREEKRREDLKDIDPPNPPRGREPKKTYPYPEQLNAEAWEEWKTYRSEMRFKSYAPTERSEGAAITELINLSGGNQTRQMQIVKQSMAKGWKGLFELKGGTERRDVNAISEPDTRIPPGFRGGPTL
ncbi:DNA replication domain protein [Citrobacter amalonaticus]|uniref:DNA replication domain protein n=1 Tax=Citrobacter amalonaticus TaxID=35703 RepID=UPI0006223999|nr:DNA replication domain protein [Citrobacter amalonaticus]KKF68310.1 DNA replication domain protein [Vibrio parahaemolyticus]KKY40144.1 DNA replication domain protein [Vibrio parahaemolyticus]KOP97027.1 DNA replication domain protein [Citrobacter amalonaticus]KOP98399.1 DNA replication domain protein [Citrobacter amalonaticus]